MANLATARAAYLAAPTVQAERAADEIASACVRIAECGDTFLDTSIDHGVRAAVVAELRRRGFSVERAPSGFYLRVSGWA